MTLGPSCRHIWNQDKVERRGFHSIQESIAMGQQVPLSECAGTLRPIVSAFMGQSRVPRDVCGFQVFGQSAGDLSSRLVFQDGVLVGRAGEECFSYTSVQKRLTKLPKGICKHAQMTQRIK